VTEGARHDSSRLIASGRSADVYDIGDGRVLRRLREGVVPEGEVVAMREARSHGVPVPEVYEVDGADMVLERIDGRSMLDELGARPWRVRRIGRQLAELHLQLRAVPPPDELAGSEPRESLVHDDLHPGNVILARTGPVAIDWEGAGAGPADRDAATFWLLAVVAEPDDVDWYLRPVLGLVRRRLVASFLAVAGTPRPETVDAVCADRLEDRNMRSTEKARIVEFRQRHGTPPREVSDAT
jgi:aminoglycoside phosphotransferase (APT) family kinase protein